MGDDGCKVYVGGLPFSIDQHSLREHFESAGYTDIDEAIVIMERDDPGKSRGFGFVTFSSQTSANAAVKNMDGSDCDGRSLRVNIASGKRGGGRGGGGGFRGRSDYGGGRSYQSGSGSRSYGSPYGGGGRGGGGGGGGRYGDRDSYGGGRSGGYGGGGRDNGYSGGRSGGGYSSGGYGGSDSYGSGY